MYKISNIIIANDGCGPYRLLSLSGLDASFFTIYNNDLYFLPQEQDICKSQYIVNITLQSISGLLSKTITYTLNTNNYSCTTTIPPIN